MLRLIIVDDEYLLRQLIRNIIDWKALDIEVVGEMASAELAMRQLESLKPDIILTDICMPDIDGLTFAEKIKGRNPDTKVIAITGYDNFEYAKRGICIGLDGYILKPINIKILMDSGSEGSDHCLDLFVSVNFIQTCLLNIQDLTQTVRDLQGLEV